MGGGGWVSGWRVRHDLIANYTRPKKHHKRSREMPKHLKHESFEVPTGPRWNPQIKNPLFKKKKKNAAPHENTNATGGQRLQTFESEP